MDAKQTEDLLNRYNNEQTSPEENAWVESWFNSFISVRQSKPLDVTDKARRDRIWSKLGIVHKPRQVYPFIRYAAAALIALAGFSWLYITNVKTDSIPFAKINKDYTPGENKAILTLSNGKEVSLHSLTGQVAASSANGVLISNNAATGIVTFRFPSGKAEGTTGANKNEGLNAITTPRSGQYQLVLSDGTKVFLNAESKISFPSRFTGHSRIVSISGEVYFQVAKDTSHPFQVNTTEQQLTVTGTHFNINAYPGEPVKTTLAEGSVILLQPSTGIRQSLKPAQQATLLSKHGFEVKTVNPSLELAWIDGMFIFHGTPLKEAMRQISRWYNVEVDYNSLPDIYLEANLYRTLSLKQLLQTIDLYGKFDLEDGRRLVYVK